MLVKDDRPQHYHEKPCPDCGGKLLMTCESYSGFCFYCLGCGQRFVDTDEDDVVEEEGLDFENVARREREANRSD
jgi:DNA-directed RNA polymerase subunit RPC12/RpoP